MKDLNIDKRFIETVEMMNLNGYRIEKAIPFFKQVTYSRIKNGVQSISKKYLDAFCDTFNADKNYILTGINSIDLPKVTESQQLESRKGINNRFLEIISKIYSCDKDFYEIANIKKSAFSNVRTGKQNASIEYISSLCELNPNVNANYILTGRGYMFNDENDTLDFENSQNNINKVPSPESAEYWQRLYKATKVIYEEILKNALNKAKDIDKDLQNGIKAINQEAV